MKVASGNISYFIRMRVVNEGRSTAENVQVFAEKLDPFPINAIDSSGTLKRFFPMNLFWSHDRAIARRIPAKVFQHCDLGEIAHPNDVEADTRLQLQLPTDKSYLQIAVISNATFTKLSCLHRGTYVLHLSISADNADTVRRLVKIELDGEWYDNDNDMRSTGCKVSVLR